jgi:hypothetical protein
MIPADGASASLVSDGLAARRAGGASESGSSASQVVSNVAGFGENLLNMAELQAKMSAIELRQNVDALKAAAAVAVIGVVLGIAALPVVLAGIAELLVSELGVRRGIAFFSVGTATVGIAAFGVLVAAVWMRRKHLGFPLSAEEFTRNLNWVRTVIRLSGRELEARR